MGYYSSPEEMYRKRAENAKKSADRHWAMAKSGEGAYHYGQAKKGYDYASENQAKASAAKASGSTWKKK